jgi:ribose transport system ATP-binding protein
MSPRMDTATTDHKGGASMAESGVPVLSLRGVTKTYPGVRALSHVDFDCFAGEIHALVGENGSGKSTLIKVASGALVPDEGLVELSGNDIAGATPKIALRQGLITAYQDTSLVQSLTVAQNFELLAVASRAPRPDDLGQLLKKYGMPFKPTDVVSDLGPGGRQMLEVVRALILKPRVLLLDEPTAALDVDLAARLHELVKEARSLGVAIVYISHRLDEVRELADRLTVIRDGEIQGSYVGSGWEVDHIVELMVGAPLDLEFPQREATSRSAVPALELTDLFGASFGPVSLNVGAGEIVGIAGAEGNGQRALLRGVIGVGRDGGELLLDGKKVTGNSPQSILREGINFQSGDRAAESVFLPLSVMHNATVQLGKEAGPLGTVSYARLRARYSEVKSRLGIVSASHYQPVGALSGGNQQKIVMARPALTEPRVLIVDEPTQGVDAKARLDTYKTITDAAAQGVAVLVNSSDSSELAGLCDRVYIMSRGRIVKELERPLEESEIVHSFVTAGASASDERDGSLSTWRRLANRVRASSLFPVLVLAVLIAAVAVYAGSRNPLFWTPVNLSNLFITAAPAMILAMGQLFALVAGGFDISIGSQVSLAVVLASFFMADFTAQAFATGLLVVMAAAVAIGLFNAMLVGWLKVNPIVATIGTLGIVQGIAVLLRPAPGGAIALEFSDVLRLGVGPFPTIFLCLVGVAVLLDVILTRTRPGLALRGVGFDSESSRRVGVSVNVIRSVTLILCAIAAGAAGILVATQVGLGENSVGVNFTLPAFAACFLGGAALSGGRGSYIGAALGALFLALLVNVAPLLALNNYYTQILTGLIMLVAVIVFTRRGSRAT